MPRYGTIDHDYALRLAATDPDGDIYMLNLMAYRAEADYGPDGERGVTGRQADDRYAPLDVLADLGAAVCFLADVESASEPWDRIAVVRYPTRRSFIDMQSRPDFQGKHVHKEAGMDHTTIVATVPTGELPKTVAGDLLLLELWDGTAPAPVVGGDAVEFSVEGTIIGDGRSWSGVRYTPIDVLPDLTAGDTRHQLIALRTVVAQWES
jgi:hypothetical protein